MPACTNWSVSDAEIRCGYESSFATPPTDGYLINAANFAASASRDRAVRPILNSDAVNAKASVGGRTAGLSIDIQMGPETLGVFLYARHGAPTTTAVGSAWTSTTALSLNAPITVTTSATLMLKVTTAGTTGSTEPDLSSGYAAGDTFTGDGTVSYLVIPKLYKHIFTPSVLCQTPMTVEGKVATGEYIRVTGAKINNMTVNPQAAATNIVATVEFDAADAAPVATSFLSGTETDLTGDTNFLEHSMATYSGSQTMSVISWSVSEERPLSYRQTLNGSPNASHSFEGKYNPNGNVSLFGEATNTFAARS